MAKCPNCGKEVLRPEKSLTNRVFTVEAYKCNDCKTKFKETHNL
jgi:predicted RNA-binding Zn-ribbon protein involved in translation (DUF1610 family)